MIDIRRITPAEWPAYRRVRLAALADSPEAFSKPLARAEALADADWQRLAREGAAGGVNCAVLAHDGADPVGLACGLSDPADPRRAYVVAMWVAPAHRGGSVASRLLETVEDWAADRGARTVVLGVTACNERALAFYRKQGYVDRAAGDPGHPAIDDCAVVLEKPLPPRS